MTKRYGDAAQKAVEKEMRYRKTHGKNISRQQAIAIGLAKARRRGAKMPRRPARSIRRGR
jgi:hypothetical protein